LRLDLAFSPLAPVWNSARTRRVERLSSCVADGFTGKT
jgi:hypothetical protein